MYWREIVFELIRIVLKVKMLVVYSLKREIC